MANALYDKFKEALQNKIHDMNTDEIDVVLVDGADYTSNIATDDELADVPAGARVAVSAAVTSPTIVDGVFDHADFTWSSVSGDQSEAVVYYNDTTAASPVDGLVCLFDTGITWMPVTPNGGDINVTVNASGVYAL